MTMNADAGASIALLWPSLPQTVRTTRSTGRTASSARGRTWEAEPWLRDADAVVFVDIETTGLSRHYDELTMVGYQVAGRHHVFVAGDDPGHLLSVMASARCIVTFNGSLFDLPFLRKTFPGIAIPERHVDLRFAVRKVGLRGGQKAVEQELGFTGRHDVTGIDGRSAVLLWHRYLRGDTGALRQLIRYNLADVDGMRVILEVVRERLETSAPLFAAARFAGTNPILTGWSVPDAILPDAARLGRPRFDFAGLLAATPAGAATIVGIDLTGSAARRSGFCILRGAHATTSSIATDDEIVAATVAAAPGLVSIDSPLSLPMGRTSVRDDDPGRAQFGIMRVSERVLKRRGINVYPCLLPSMQKLTERGMRLAAALRRLGIPVIESYPGAAQDIIGIPRKGAGEHLLKEGLRDFGLTGEYITRTVTHDELDAITSALVGSFFLAGRYEELAAPKEASLIIPDLTRTASDRIVIGVSGRIGSGKSAVARMIENCGFSYARVSQVVDRAILDDGLPPSRETRQAYGWRLHAERGQRQMIEDTVALVGSAQAVVIDGLRFLEDRATLVELFGGRLVHVHVRADEAVRARRKDSSPTEPAWMASEAAPTEAEVDRLETVADVVLENTGDIRDLEPSIIEIVARSTGPEGSACRSQS